MFQLDDRERENSKNIRRGSSMGAEREQNNTNVIKELLCISKSQIGVDKHDLVLALVPNLSAWV